MRSLKTTLAALLLVLALAPAVDVSAESTGSPQSADAIMTKVDHAVRKSIATQLAQVKLTTCRYTVADGKVRCIEKPRNVVFENVRKLDVVDGLYNERSLGIVIEPSSDKGTGLLVYEYGERDRDNDNWLYLPALGKVIRVTGNDDEGGSVFGSEFSVESTENPEGRKIYEYTYSIVEETTYQDRPVWVIETRPNEKKARKTSYTRIVTWIDKQTYLPVKEDLYRNGKLHKQRTETDIKEIDGVFVATKVTMNNLSSSRVSQMDKVVLVHNKSVPDAYLTQRALTDFAFREQNRTAFRSYLQ